MSPGNPKPTQKNRRIALVVVLGSVALLVLLAGLAVVPTVEVRRSTYLEQEYVRLAMDLRSPSLCEKIATDSYVAAANGILARSRIYYVQSQCYWEVASFAANSKLCEKVRPFPLSPLRALTFDGNDYTPQTCMDHLSHPDRQAFTHLEFPVAFLELLGYVAFEGDEPIALDRRLYRAEFAYLKLQESGENVEKAARLPVVRRTACLPRIRLRRRRKASRPAPGGKRRGRPASRLRS